MANRKERGYEESELVQEAKRLQKEAKAILDEAKRLSLIV